MTRLWEKGEAVDQAILEFCVGDDHQLDERLVVYDVRASTAHATVLKEQGLLSVAEHKALLDALEAIGREHAAGEWHISVEEEDVHTALENRLHERAGAAGLRIHAGRSRNDQVLAALRLYLLDVIETLSDGAQSCREALADLSAEQGHIRLPGYTHLRRAMPSTAALWSDAYGAEIADDIEGVHATRRRLDKNPLGSAAGYGVPVLELPVNRSGELLGFSKAQLPVTSVQLSRGKAESQLAFEACLLLQDLGRLASDVILYSTDEFGFLRLPHSMTTGSSIMPQKRNPDVFELVRAHAAQAPSDLDAIVAITQKMTSGYHRDLQLIKAPLFRIIDRTVAVLKVMPSAISGLRFMESATEACMDASLFAAESAYRLVKEKGLPFREAYRIVASQLSQAPSATQGEDSAS